MNTLDIILLVLLLPAVLSGIRKGFVSQIFSIAAIVLGAWLAVHSCSYVADWMINVWDGPGMVVKAISFILVFVCVSVLLGIVAGAIEKFLKLVTLGWLNRLAGIVFAVIKYIIVLAVLVSVFNAVNSKLELVGSDMLDGSRIYRFISDISSKFFPFVKELINK